MATITLHKDRHVLVENEQDRDGNWLILDQVDQSTFYITPTSEVLDFFGLSFPSCKKTESNTNEQPIEANSLTIRKCLPLQTKLEVDPYHSRTDVSTSLHRSKMYPSGATIRAGLRRCCDLCMENDCRKTWKFLLFWIFIYVEEEVLENIKEINSHLIGVGEIVQKIVLKDKILNLIHLNIRSVRKNFDDLLVFLESFNLFLCDIIILSECWQIESVNQFNIKNYTSYYNSADINQNDGVLILIKSELNADITNYKLPQSGITVSRVNFLIKNISYGISALYRPPPTSLETFINDFDIYLEQKITNDVEIIAGDFNIDILDNKNIHVTNYQSSLCLHGFKSYINQPTRVTNESSTCIDHIFIKNRLNNISKYEAFRINYDITDHYPIMLHISQQNKMSKENNKLNTITKIDYQKLTQLLEKQNWSNILNTNNPEIATQNFTTGLTNIIEKSQITKLIKFKNHNKIKQWITNGIITSIKTRDKMKKNLLKNHTVAKETKYKNYRNNLNRTIKNAKNTYYREKINQNSKDIKKIYELVAEATNENKKNCNKNIQILDNNHKNFMNDKEMSNFCNNYFSEIGINMSQTIPIPNEPLNTTWINQSSMFLKQVTDNELIKHIHSLKSNSCPGIDGITVRTIKIIHTYILTPLRHIINLIFKTGIVPRQYKTSIIVPIYKSGNHNAINNYRPISLINNFTKIFEKCLKERLVNFLNINKILSEHQYGFTEGLSINDAVYELIKEITNRLDNNQKCIAVFLDLAKAFDTVPHNRLLDVLEQYGVRGGVLEVFDSYLSDRIQQVRIRDTLSDQKSVQIGIPQGTVLGPILFNIYITSLTNMNINGKTISYADDTVIIFNGSTWDEVKNHVKNEIKMVKDWLDTNKLSLNVTKTNYIAFSLTSSNRPAYRTIKIDNLDQEIRETTNTKYLGIIIDQNVKWDMHIAYLTKKIRCLIHKFYILRNIIDQKLIITLYQTLVESLLRYGIIVWGGLYNNALRQLNVIQNTILKIIYKKDRLFHTNQLYTEEICNVRTLYLTSICSYIHKHDRLKEYVNHNHNTRKKVNQHLKIPSSNKNVQQRFINYLAPKCYNKLPLSIKEIRNIKKFSIACKKYIFQNNSDFINYLF